jgi:surface polysaccharide O-acyltransferase-like enzyme
VLAVLGVILWHTDLLLRLRELGGGHWPVDLTIDLIWWVSLPFFFLVAGYFYGKSVAAEGHPIGHLSRYASSLFGILVVWVCIYTVIPSNWLVAVRDHGWWQPFQLEALKNVNLLGTQHFRLFLEGEFPVWHLWFLPALIFGLANVAVIVVFRLQRYMIPFMVGLYGLALAEEVAGGHFHGLSVHFGLWSIATLFTVLGAWLAGRRQTSISTAISLILAGYAIAFVEWVVMREVFHATSTYKHHYAGGILLPLGVFLLALAKPDLWRSTPLPALAKYTLGVYVCHVLMIYTLTGVRWRLENLFPLLAPLWPFLFPFTVYFAGVLFTFILWKVPITKYLVLRAPHAPAPEMPRPVIVPSAIR